MARLWKGLVSTWSAYALPPSVPSPSPALPSSTAAVPDFTSVYLRLKAENDSLRREVTTLKKKLSVSEACLREVTMRVKTCCGQQTVGRVLAGIGQDGTEASALVGVLDTFVESVFQESQLEDGSEKEALTSYRRKLAGLESRLDAQLHKSDTTLSSLLSKLPMDKDIFLSALDQIRTHYNNSPEPHNEPTYVDSLIRKVNVLSAYETLKQSVIRYDLMSVERLFSTVTDVTLEAESSVLSQVHTLVLPAELLTQVDTLVSRRVDLTNEFPSVESVTQLLRLLAQYAEMYRLLARPDLADNEQVCDLITVAHKVGQLATDSQRNLQQLAHGDILESRVHALQSALLMAKASLVATESGTVEYLNRLFRLLRDQDAVKLDILRKNQDERAEADEKTSKTATELQALAMETLQIVTQIASFSHKSYKNVFEMVSILPENELQIVKFSEEVRKKCEEILEQVGEMEEPEGEFLLGLLRAVEKVVGGDQAADLASLCSRLKRHIVEGRIVGKTQTKRIMPWGQTKDLVIRTLQLLALQKTSN